MSLKRHIPFKQRKVNEACPPQELAFPEAQRASLARPSHALRRLDPGVYVDEEGALHLDLAELLAAAGIAASRENMTLLEQAARELVAERFPGVPVVTDDER
ncbi:MAG TPA: hypothetical protein VNQ79_18640 [Blastocatellia bacterium]|nr:hypothetical protein [Blastocatellia bacterium]